MQVTETLGWRTAASTPSSTLWGRSPNYLLQPQYITAAAKAVQSSRESLPELRVSLAIHDPRRTGSLSAGMIWLSSYMQTVGEFKRKLLLPGFVIYPLFSIIKVLGIKHQLGNKVKYCYEIKFLTCSSSILTIFIGAFIYKSSVLVKLREFAHLYMTFE